MKIPIYSAHRLVRKGIIYILLIAFIFSGLPRIPAEAQDIRLPVPGVRIHVSPPLDPPMLKGIKVHPDNPFRFDFILDKGDSGIADDQLKDESTKLIKYFLASITVPEKDLWVNLSPYEKDRIIPKSFGLTEMGRDLLAEDYMLKQITASLIYPEEEVGKKFWKRIYEEASKKYGTTNIPVNTFNKVWIIPEKAVVYENAKAGTAYVVESKLKVMLEEDYLSLEKHSDVGAGSQPAQERAGYEPAPTVNNLHSLASQIVREVVIPELTTEVNEGKNFAQLRQVYNSLILATWYKKKIKDSILAQVYADRNKVAGVGYDRSLIAKPSTIPPVSLQNDVSSINNVSLRGASETSDEAILKRTTNPNKIASPSARNDTSEGGVNDVDLIYQRYLKAFKKGVYNYIKEEPDPITHETIPRKYFSGGTTFSNEAMNAAMVINNDSKILRITKSILLGGLLTLSVFIKDTPSNIFAQNIKHVSAQQRYDGESFLLAALGGLIDPFPKYKIPIQQAYDRAYALVDPYLRKHNITPKKPELTFAESVNFLTINQYAGYLRGHNIIVCGLNVFTSERISSFLKQRYLTHELMHSNSIQSEWPSFLEEAFADFFTGKIINESSAQEYIPAYPDNVGVLERLCQWTHNSKQMEDALFEVYFHGNQRPIIGLMGRDNWQRFLDLTGEFQNLDSTNKKAYQQVLDKLRRFIETKGGQSDSSTASSRAMMTLKSGRGDFQEYVENLRKGRVVYDRNIIGASMQLESKYQPGFASIYDEFRTRVNQVTLDAGVMPYPKGLVQIAQEVLKGKRPLRASPSPRNEYYERGDFYSDVIQGKVDLHVDLTGPQASRVYGYGDDFAHFFEGLRHDTDRISNIIQRREEHLRSDPSFSLPNSGIVEFEDYIRNRVVNQNQPYSDIGYRVRRQYSYGREFARLVNCSLWYLHNITRYSELSQKALALVKRYKSHWHATRLRGFEEFEEYAGLSTVSSVKEAGMGLDLPQYRRDASPEFRILLRLLRDKANLFFGRDAWTEDNVDPRTVIEITQDMMDHLGEIQLNPGERDEFRQFYTWLQRRLIIPLDILHLSEDDIQVLTGFGNDFRQRYAKLKKRVSEHINEHYFQVGNMLKQWDNKLTHDELIDFTLASARSILAEKASLETRTFSGNPEQRTNNSRTGNSSQEVSWAMTVTEEERRIPGVGAVLDDAEVKELMGQEVGVPEGYSLEVHTRRVLDQFHHYFAEGVSWLEDFNQGAFTLLLFLHDVGKPKSKFAQHQESTNTILRLYHEGKLPLRPKQMNILLALINGDPLGEYFKKTGSVSDNDLREAISEIREMSFRSGISLREFFRLLTIYYQCDSSSYPGLQRRLYHSEGAQGLTWNGNQQRLAFNPENERRYQLLERAVAEEENRIAEYKGRYFGDRIIEGASEEHAKQWSKERVAGLSDEEYKRTVAKNSRIIEIHTANSQFVPAILEDGHLRPRMATEATNGTSAKREGQRRKGDLHLASRSVHFAGGEMVYDGVGFVFAAEALMENHSFFYSPIEEIPGRGNQVSRDWITNGMDPSDVTDKTNGVDIRLGIVFVPESLRGQLKDHFAQHPNLRVVYYQQSTLQEAINAFFGDAIKNTRTPSVSGSLVPIGFTNDGRYEVDVGKGEGLAFASSDLFSSELRFDNGENKSSSQLLDEAINLLHIREDFTGVTERLAKEKIEQAINKDPNNAKAYLLMVYVDRVREHRIPWFERALAVGFTKDDVVFAESLESPLDEYRMSGQYQKAQDILALLKEWFPYDNPAEDEYQSKQRDLDKERESFESFKTAMAHAATAQELGRVVNSAEGVFWPILNEAEMVLADRLIGEAANAARDFQRDARNILNEEIQQDDLTDINFNYRQKAREFKERIKAMQEELNRHHQYFTQKVKSYLIEKRVNEKVNTANVYLNELVKIAEEPAATMANIKTQYEELDPTRSQFRKTVNQTVKYSTVGNYYRRVKDDQARLTRALGAFGDQHNYVPKDAWAQATTYSEVAKRKIEQALKNKPWWNFSKPDLPDTLDLSVNSSESRKEGITVLAENMQRAFEAAKPAASVTIFQNNVPYEGLSMPTNHRAQTAQAPASPAQLANQAMPENRAMIPMQQRIKEYLPDLEKQFREASSALSSWKEHYPLSRETEDKQWLVDRLVERLERGRRYIPILERLTEQRGIVNLPSILREMGREAGTRLEVDLLPHQKTAIEILSKEAKKKDSIVRNFNPEEIVFIEPGTFVADFLDFTDATGGRFYGRNTEGWQLILINDRLSTVIKNVWTIAHETIHMRFHLGEGIAAQNGFGFVHHLFNEALTEGLSKQFIEDLKIRRPEIDTGDIFSSKSYEGEQRLLDFLRRTRGNRAFVIRSFFRNWRDYFVNHPRLILQRWNSRNEQAINKAVEEFLISGNEKLMLRIFPEFWNQLSNIIKVAYYPNRTKNTLYLLADAIGSDTPLRRLQLCAQFIALMQSISISGKKLTLSDNGYYLVLEELRTVSSENFRKSMMDIVSADQGVVRQDITIDEASYNSILKKLGVVKVENQEMNLVISGQGASRAMNGQEKRGGIDLTSNQFLQTQNSGGEIKFHVDPAMMAQLQTSPGFEARVISIQPMNNFREFLGILENEKSGNSQLTG